MSDSTAGTHAGYVSEAGKRSFTITAGLLGAAFFFAQFLVPFLVMMAIMPGFVTGMNAKLADAHPERGALWRGRIWYTETRSSIGPESKPGTALLAFSLTGPDDPEPVAELEAGNPWLLAGPDRLWLISSSFLGSFREGRLETLREGKTLGDISRPFLYRGRPALFESRPEGERLLVLDGADWVEERKVDLGLDAGKWSIDKDLQAYWDGTRIHLLLRYGGSLYHLPGLPGAPGTEEWTPVADSCEEWILASSGGAPAVFTVSFLGKGADAGLVGRELRDGVWREGPRTGPLLPGRTGVFGLDGGAYAVLHRDFPGSLRYMELRDGGPARDVRKGNPSPFPEGFIGMMMIPQAVTVLMPFFLALILSGLMARHRVTRHEAQGDSLPYASLTRRALAQLLDGLLLGGPLVAGWISIFHSIFDFEEMMESGLSSCEVLGRFGILGFGLFWLLGGLLLFSFTEGRWGLTPGKWALGIRVLGTDHYPCGFGRAILRNLLIFVDGFFNFLVGVMVVALSENWQRLGDMAARTVVVEMRKLPPVSGPDGLFQPQ